MDAELRRVQRLADANDDSYPLERAKLDRRMGEGMWAPFEGRVHDPQGVRLALERGYASIDYEEPITYVKLPGTLVAIAAPLTIYVTPGWMEEVALKDVRRDGSRHAIGAASSKIALPPSIASPAGCMTGRSNRTCRSAGIASGWTVNRVK